MHSFGYPQWILASWLTLVVIGAPIIRAIMIRYGATGFVPWRDFWKTWAADIIGKAALVGLLHFGGFWG